MVAICAPVKQMVIATISQLLVGQSDSEMGRWVTIRLAWGNVKASAVLERLNSNSTLKFARVVIIPDLGLVEGHVVPNI
jgi:hypothetical protein